VREELGRPDLTVQFFGKTSMADQGCLKLIALYTARSAGPFIPDHSQIAELRFFSLSEIQAALRQGTMVFTPTFLHLLDYYAGGHGQPTTT
jgi:hypothetical protein